ncbi:hypothetical protein ACSSS7_006132 [Eimeria intestinalis]
MWFFGGWAAALLLLASPCHASAVIHDSTGPAETKPAITTGNAQEVQSKPALRRGVTSGVQQPPEDVFSSRLLRPAAAVASSSAITFFLADHLHSGPEVGDSNEGPNPRSLALAHIERSTELMSIGYQLELLKLSDYDQSLLTREELRMVAKARKRFEIGLEAYYSQQEQVRRMRAAITAREQALRNIEPEAITYEDVQERRLQLKQMRKNLTKMKLSLAQTVGWLSSVQWDHRQDVLSLNMKARALDNGRWLTPEAARALAAQQRINLPNFPLSLGLTRDERTSVKRLVNEYLRIAEEMRKRIAREPLSKKLAVQASNHVSDMGELLQELRLVGMKEEASAVVARAVKLEVALARSLPE